MKNYILLYILLLAAVPSKGQYTFHGKIEFERKSNVHRQLDDMKSDDEEQGGSESWYSKMKTLLPKFHFSYFDYSFSQQTAFYRPGKEGDAPLKMFSNSPASSNEVFTDFRNRQVTAQKQVFEQKFLVKDSLRQLEWKITDEIRTIANYKCRKAVGRICDSVYVVAFYTDDIAVSGGPEMFGGLPGMILEIAIPRLYTTWIATKVEPESPKPQDYKAPEKGKKVTQKEMHDTLQESISKWGKWAQRSIWWSVL